MKRSEMTRAQLEGLAQGAIDLDAYAIALKLIGRRTRSFLPGHRLRRDRRRAEGCSQQ